MKTRRSRANLRGAIALLAGMAFLAGCGSRDKGRAPARAGEAGGSGQPGQTGQGGAPGAAPGGPLVNSSNLAPPKGGTPYQSPEGGFSVVWPAGCNIIHTRLSPKGATSDNMDFFAAGCDRHAQKGEGATITVYNKLRGPDGGPPTPRAVTAKIEEMTQTLNLQVVEQHPLSGGPLEGVRAYCREPGSSNVMWIQGLLHGDRVYILSAWKPQGSAFSDGDIVRFFQSFRVAGAR